MDYVYLKHLNILYFMIRSQEKNYVVKTPFNGIPSRDDKLRDINYFAAIKLVIIQDGTKIVYVSSISNSPICIYQSNDQHNRSIKRVAPI